MKYTVKLNNAIVHQTDDPIEAKVAYRYLLKRGDLPKAENIARLFLDDEVIQTDIIDHDSVHSQDIADVSNNDIIRAVVDKMGVNGFKNAIMERGYPFSNGHVNSWFATGNRAKPMHDDELYLVVQALADAVVQKEMDVQMERIYAILQKIPYVDKPYVIGCNYPFDPQKVNLSNPNLFVDKVDECARYAINNQVCFYLNRDRRYPVKYIAPVVINDNGNVERLMTMDELRKLIKIKA